MTPNLAIVGCGATKRPGTHTARELYTGPLFRAAVADVEARGVPWLVLSAEHGLIPPARPIAPYDRTIEQQRREAWRWNSAEPRPGTVIPACDDLPAFVVTRRWPLGSKLQGFLGGVWGRLGTHLWWGDPVTTPVLPPAPGSRELAPAVVEVHAGAAYVEALVEAFETRSDLPITWLTPLAGLQIGQRLGWYAARRRHAPGEQLALWRAA